MMRISKFVLLQMLTTTLLVVLVGYTLSLVPGIENLAFLFTWIFIYSAILSGIFPCVLGAVINASSYMKKSSFTAKSIISWFFSFLSTLFLWNYLGLAGGAEEWLGRMLLILLPAIFSLCTWIFYAKKFLRS